MIRQKHIVRIERVYARAVQELLKKIQRLHEIHIAAAPREVGVTLRVTGQQVALRLGRQSQKTHARRIFHIAVDGLAAVENQRLLGKPPVRIEETGPALIARIAPRACPVGETEHQDGEQCRRAKRPE